MLYPPGNSRSPWKLLPLLRRRLGDAFPSALLHRDSKEEPSERLEAAGSGTGTSSRTLPAPGERPLPNAPSSPSFSSSGAGLVSSQAFSFGLGAVTRGGKAPALEQPLPWLPVPMPRFRGWLVRRICGLLAACSWRIPADTPGDLPARICCSRRWEQVEGLYGVTSPPCSTPRPVGSHWAAGAREPGIVWIARGASTSSIPLQGAGCCSRPWPCRG